MGNAFSGGIFIAVAIMDLIPDSVEMINESGIAFTDLSWLLILVGYVLVFVIEKMFEEPEPEHTHQPEDLANPALGSLGMHNINGEKQEIREDLLATEPLCNTRKVDIQESTQKKSSYKAYVMAVALSIHSVSST
jgi:zinc transporter ZupT